MNLLNIPFLSRLRMPVFAIAKQIPLDSGETNAGFTGKRENKYAPPRFSVFAKKWFAAFKHVFPIYLIIHLGLFMITICAILITFPDFDSSGVPLHTLWQVWNQWDAQHFQYIAIHGYTDSWRSAFFPLYPILIRELTIIVHSPFFAAFVISNIAGLLMLMVLHQLISEDFNQKQANTTVFYLSLFPTAFFFAAPYNEGLFLFLALLSFYQMRRGQWWFAGIAGFFACLTRSTGLLLVLPFLYEYLRQNNFKLKNIRISIFSATLIPAAIVLFALYCYKQFGDPLAFSHAQAYWNHKLSWPWYATLAAIQVILSTPPLSFVTLRVLTDLIPNLLILALIVLSIVGPWRFPRTHWSYCILALAFYIFIQLFPVVKSSPWYLQSFSRYMLEIFPAFVVLASAGKNRLIQMSYLSISLPVFFYLLVEFLQHHYVV